MQCFSPLPYSKSSCSGNGFVCQIPDIGCICNFGWSSFGDFSVDSSGAECSINYRAVRIMSYFCIIIPFISSILIIWHYISLAIHLKVCCVISWDHRKSFPLCFLILGIAAGTYGILKVSYTDGQQPLVGRDISISLIFFIFTTFGWLGFNIYTNLIIDFLKSYSLFMKSESKDRILKQFDKLGFYSWFILPGAFIFSILPLIATGYPSQSSKLCMSSLIGLAAVAFVYGFLLTKCLTFLIRELNNYIETIEEHESGGIKLVVRKLNTAYFAVLGACFMVAILLLIFGSSNFLFHLTTYFMLLTCTGVPPVTLAMVMTVSRMLTSDSPEIIIPNEDEEKFAEA